MLFCGYCSKPRHQCTISGRVARCISSLERHHLAVHPETDNRVVCDTWQKILTQRKVIDCATNATNAADIKRVVPAKDVTEQVHGTAIQPLSLVLSECSLSGHDHGRVCNFYIVFC